MKRNELLALAVMLLIPLSVLCGADDTSVTRDAKSEGAVARLREPLSPEMVARATTPGDLLRLHRLFQAAAQGGEYTVGIIGGSITAGAAASSMEKHYSIYVIRWLKQHFPNAT